MVVGAICQQPMVLNADSNIAHMILKSLEGSLQRIVSNIIN